MTPSKPNPESDRLTEQNSTDRRLTEQKPADCRPAEQSSTDGRPTEQKPSNRSLSKHEQEFIWGDKRYHSLDYHLKKRYGQKVYKVALDGGMTCPNRDGTLGRRGCIFCSAGGSGDFAAKRCESVTKQIDGAIAGISSRKTTGSKFIAYFQSYTNTYAPLSYLENLFGEALSHPKIAALSIGTRPDCLGDDVITLLADLQRRFQKQICVELGLQTIHEKTAVFIRRGYSLPVFEQAVSELKKHSLEVVVHVILGLPWETKEMMMQTVSYLSEKRFGIDGIKLQLLHVLKDTDLAAYLGQFPILSMEEYIDLVICALELLPPDMVIHRLTGDGPKALLLAPAWSSQKRTVLNNIHHELKIRNSCQGRLYKV